MSSPLCPECGMILSWSCTSEVGSIGKATCNAYSAIVFNNKETCYFQGEVRRTSSYGVELLPFKAPAKIPKRLNA